MTDQTPTWTGTPIPGITLVSATGHPAANLGDGTLELLNLFPVPPTLSWKPANTGTGAATQYNIAASRETIAASGVAGASITVDVDYGALPDALTVATVNLVDVVAVVDNQITINGVDLTSAVIEEAYTDAERGAAHAAQVKLYRPGLYEPEQYVNRAVTLRLGGVKVFQGFVDDASVNIHNAQVSLRLSDRLQRQVADLTDAQATALGVYDVPELLMPRDATPWRRLQARLRYTLASVELDLDGNAVLHPWAAGTVDHTFDQSHVIEQSVRFDAAPARTLFNHVTLRITGSFRRQWERRFTVNWTYPRSFSFYLEHPTTLPTKALMRQACERTGWAVQNPNWTEYPPTGRYLLGSGPDFTNWNKNRDDVILGASVPIAKRWLQSVDDVAEIDITLPESIARHGDLHRTVTERVRLGAGEDGDFESGPVDDVLPNSTDAGNGYRYRTETLAANYDDVVKAKVAQVLVDLESAHRDNPLSFTVRLNANVRRGQTVRINAAIPLADGRVRRVRATSRVLRLQHRYDPQGGVRLTTVTLAMLRGGATATDYGTVPTKGTTALPTIATDTIGTVLPTQLGGEDPTQQPYDDDRPGYSGNYEPVRDPTAPIFEHRLDVEHPEVPAAVRDTHEPVETLNYVVSLADEELEIAL